MAGRAARLLGEALGAIGSRLAPVPPVATPRPPAAGVIRGDGANAPEVPYRRADRAKPAPDATIRGVETVFDSWQNLVTGMGDPTRDKILQAGYSPLIELEWSDLENLYYGDDMAERIVEALPDECFRRFCKFEGPVAEELTQKFAALDAETKLRDAHGNARHWGGAAIIVGADDSNVVDKPLDLERARDVKFLNVVDRRYIIPFTYYDKPFSPKFGLPELYTVTPAFGGSTGGPRVHESRLIRFYGTRIDPITTRRVGGWSYSALQRPYDVLRMFGSAFSAAAQLTNDAGQAVFSVKNLISQLSGNMRASILQRFATLDMQRWAGRMLLIDKDNEEFRREPVQVTGVDKLLEHFEMRLAAAARMPVTMLMGRSPTGMDATGESDLKLWHAYVKGEQSKILEPNIRQLADILTAGRWGKDSANKIVWAAMQEPNDKDEAEVEKLRADKWKIYNDMGSVSGEQIALVEFCDKPIEEVLDEKALEAIVKSDIALAKSMPAAQRAAAAAGVVPAAPGEKPNGKAGTVEPPPNGGKEAPGAGGK